MLDHATCAKLYNYPDKPAPEGAIVIPEVAKGSPKVSRDSKTQTIELKRSYRFHTGQRITAANFVAAFNRDANPKLQSPATQYLHDIVGADAVMTGRKQAISGVQALGPYTLRIRTKEAFPDLVARLTMPFLCPIATSTPLHEIADPLGSGPYYVASRVPNRQIVLQRNRFYRGPRPANVDHIVWSIELGVDACREAVDRDEMDYCATGVGPRAYTEIAAKYGINRQDGQFFFNPALSDSYFAFNHDRAAFKGPGQIPLMKAINWAIDRHALVQATGYLGGKRTDQILPPAMARKASIYPLGGVTQESLARARELLAKARFKPKRLVLYTPSFQPPGAWAQIFQFDLKRLGIDVEIKYFQSYTAMSMRTGIRGEPHDVVNDGWFADYADPISFFGTLNGENIRPTGNTNSAYFNLPKWNREIERISRLSGDARRRAWAELDVELMRDDPPWAPFMNGVQHDFISRSFGCYVFQPVLGSPDLVAACKK
jgi:oligopeptide transport system substrate-binding protein